MKSTVAVLTAACALLAAHTVHGQDAYPSRAIIMIVPFAADGTSDVIARIVAEQMGPVLGQRIINGNVPGAGGTTALTHTARAAPDGYTLVIGNVGANAASYAIHPEIKYTTEDFVPIGLAAKTLPVIVIKNAFPAKADAEFLDLAKKTPGKINLGHAGVGSSNYLICKAFLVAAKVDVTLVSYRGVVPAHNDQHLCEL